MNTEKQIKALAELDGLTFVDDAWAESVKKRRLDEWLQTLPNYLTSYDVIIPLMQKQLQKHFIALEDVIADMLDLSLDDHQGLNLESLFQITPSQLCEALLKATGKWEV